MPSRFRRRTNWRLEPGPAKTEIQINRVRIRRLEIDAVEQIFLIAVIVKNLEFRSIEKAACVQSVNRNEVPPFLAAVRQIEAAADGPKVP